MKNPIGCPVLDLVPNKNNPRNSEGAFIRLAEGEILFIYSLFNGDSAHDDQHADLAKISSLDEGKTWSMPEILFTAYEHDAQNIMSASLLRLDDNSIGLFYLLRKNYGDTRPYIRHSSDEGKTWGDPICCINWKGYHVLNNDRVIKLKSGRLIFAAAYHKPTANYDTINCSISLNGILHFYFSDDNGKSWDELFNYVSLNTQNGVALQEPGLVELENDTLWGFSRTGLGRQYEFFSHDNGLSWSLPAPSAFTSPESPMSIKRDPFNKTLFAIYNPIPNYLTRELQGAGWGRSPLVYSMSADEGVTWSNPVIIEDDEGCGYCYTSIHFEKKFILLAYCAGGIDDGMCLSRLRLRRIERENLTDSSRLQ